MDYRERILELVRASPLQPTNLGKILGKDSLMASAMLSEMSSKGLLKISHLKVGSSPLYYSPEHPEHLLNYLQSLNEKDRKTVELLKDKKILRDSELTPLQRACARNIKDFASPLEVSNDGSKELFWKWYLTPDAEAEELIKEVLDKAPIKVVEKPKVEESGPEKQEPEKEVEEKSVPESKREETSSENGESKPEPKKMEKERPKTKLKKSEIKPDKEEQEPDKQEASSSELRGAEQQKETRKNIGPVFVDLGDPFLKKVKCFFDNNNITIHEVNTIKKKAEFNLVIEIPTPLGSLFYFCKAKNNKRISNSDLSNAFVQGQLKKLPVVFLSPGVLTKPAKIFMKDLKGLTVTKL
ncbi:hypothetical protein GF358_00915 [Candidatus Woesearchaeota archaeon]|nr:hypothetical protein [Candidatus Woesearchaeota archaeon]